MTKNEQPHNTSVPSPWVQRFVPEIATNGTVLDVACGWGRHTRLLAAAGHAVTALDIDIGSLGDLSTHDRVTPMQANLEDGAPFALAGQTFDAIVVVNYLWRPLFGDLVNGLKPGGALIYDTFAAGNEKYGRPRNPDHLLAVGELLDVARAAGLMVRAYEHGEVSAPAPAVRQRICAIKV